MEHQGLTANGDAAKFPLSSGDLVSQVTCDYRLLAHMSDNAGVETRGNVRIYG
jgi:hypothetical protein